MSDPLEITCREVHEKLARQDNFLLLDCREQDEYDLVRIEPSQLLPLSELARRVDELHPRKLDEIVVYCHHGGRSLRVARWLQSQGFHSVKSMAGGIDEWARSIDPGLPRY